MALAPEVDHFRNGPFRLIQPVLSAGQCRLASVRRGFGETDQLANHLCDYCKRALPDTGSSSPDTCAYAALRDGAEDRTCPRGLHIGHNPKSLILRPKVAIASGRWSVGSFAPTARAL